MKKKLSLSILIALILVVTTCSYTLCESKGDTKQGVELLKANIETANKQKLEAKEALINKVVERAKSLHIESQRAATLNGYWQFDSLFGLDKSHGGSGAGSSESSWDQNNDYKNFNRSSAYLWGSYYGLGSGYVYFFPPSSGNYSIKTNYYLKGNIQGGSLTTRLIVVDTATGGVVYENNLNSFTQGTFNNNLYSPTKQIYLTGGECYGIIFQSETNASATASAALSDFAGTSSSRRYIHWNSFGLQQL